MDDNSGCLVVIVLAIIVMVAWPTSCSNAREKSYRQGQIDAANGKILYELKQLPDGSTAWERKDGE